MSKKATCSMRMLLLLGLLLPAVLFSFGSSCDSTGNGGTEPANEGTISNPMELTVGTAHSGQVGAGGTSYYKFTANNDGAHTIALTNTQSDLSWDLYSSPDFFSNLLLFCDDFFDASDEVRATPALGSGTTYFLLVDEWDDMAGTFTLTITFP